MAVFLFCDSCSLVPYWSWAEQSSSSCTFFCFPASSACLIPFKQWLYDLNSLWGQLRDSYTTITKGENTYWCYRGNMMHWKQEGVNFWTGWCVFFFILFKCLNCFHLVLHSRSYINTYMFLRRQNKSNLPWSSNSQGLPPPQLLIHCGAVLVANTWLWVPYL